MREFMMSYTWRLALTSNAMSRRERARGGAGAREGGRSAWLEKASAVLKTISPPGLESLLNTNSDWLLKPHTPYNQVEVLHKRNSQAQWRAQLKRPTTKKQTSRHQRTNKEKAKTHVDNDAVHAHLQENHRRFNGINAPVNVRPCSKRLVTKVYAIMVTVGRTPSTAIDTKIQPQNVSFRRGSQKVKKKNASDINAQNEGTTLLFYLLTVRHTVLTIITTITRAFAVGIARYKRPGYDTSVRRNCTLSPHAPRQGGRDATPPQEGFVHSVSLHLSKGAFETEMLSGGGGGVQHCKIPPVSSAHAQSA